MPPVALGIQVAKEHRLLRPELNVGDSTGDLAGDERFAARRPLMVEEDPVGSMKVVSLSVVNSDPVGIQLCSRIGRPRIKWGGLALRRFLHQAIQFRSRSLVESNALFH